MKNLQGIQQIVFSFEDFYGTPVRVIVVSYIV